ncbi:N-acetylneuraminate synthase [Methyloversatilis universalis]|uniref:N-acetylneuraminate synthase n=1 Tax=Methyloversatilis universalis TaxID=378211 RepID=UPI00039BF40F|nr:N-acetylneuraminate synthase [Methyloversatilis universalis]
MNDGQRVFVIAEAGVNHNGSLEMAIQLIDVARAAGADAVKFQTFRSEAVVSRLAPKAEYQISNTGNDESQLDMVRKLELSAESHRALVRHCEQIGIRFLSTPFDPDSATFLIEALGLELIKLPSGEITNAPFLLHVARFGRPVILSTGMSSLGEVESALGVLAYGYLGRAGVPSRQAFADAFDSTEGQAVLQEKVSLLHCTTEYPTPFDQVNLRAMDTLSAAFGLPTGLSDHTPGIVIPLAAVARGARVIEKHFTLDRTLPGPDHRASLEPEELRDMVAGVRAIESALGEGRKRMAPVEAGNRVIARRSLVAARPVVRGERWTAENLTCKRPGSGISPFDYWDMLGRSAVRDFDADELIERDGS